MENKIQNILTGLVVFVMLSGFLFVGYWIGYWAIKLVKWIYLSMNLQETVIILAYILGALVTILILYIVGKWINTDMEKKGFGKLL